MTAEPARRARRRRRDMDGSTGAATTVMSSPSIGSGAVRSTMAVSRSLSVRTTFPAPLPPACTMVPHRTASHIERRPTSNGDVHTLPVG